jgi:hypothetical protein
MTHQTPEESGKSQVFSVKYIEPLNNVRNSEGLNIKYTKLLHI